MYQALYRKWRPEIFDEVLGQDHVTTILKREVEAGKLSHAYLFTGTRGTGKTTCAKLLAKAINCEAPQNGNPCNCCDSCVGINKGNILDVQEIDAASNNGVDNVRMLREEAIYSPTAVKKRVYIIDEVHMLSNAAFNALLKIMEEPPEHLVFILATTEMHKVPATILSRCQRFQFKRIRPEDIAKRINMVAREEGYAITDDGANRLARLSDGSLRDALSLLEQCAVFDGVVDSDRISEVLGLAGNEKTAQLLKAIGKHDGGAALEVFDELYADGKEVSAILGELLVLIRDLLVLQTAPKSGMEFISGSYTDEELKTFSKLFAKDGLLYSAVEIQRTIDKLSSSSNSRTEGELCVLRLCDETLSGDLAALVLRLEKLEDVIKTGKIFISEPQKKEHSDVPFDGAVKISEKKKLSPEKKEKPIQQEEKAETEVPEGKMQQEVQTDEFWSKLLVRIKSVFTGGEYPHLSNPVFTEGHFDGRTLTLDIKNDFSKSLVNKPAVLRRIEEEAKNMGHEISVRIKQPETEKKPKDKFDDLLAFSEKFDNIKLI